MGRRASLAAIDGREHADGGREAVFPISVEAATPAEVWATRREPARALRKAAGGTPPVGLVLQTLADYRGFTLTALCRSCERYVELEHAAVAGRFGWDAALDELRRRMTCRRCGTRTGHVLVGDGSPRGRRQQPLSAEVRE